MIVCDAVFHQAEARAEFAERSVTKLQKEVDRLEGKETFWLNRFLFKIRPSFFVKTNRNFLPHALTEKLSK